MPALFWRSLQRSPPLTATGIWGVGVIILYFKSYYICIFKISTCRVCDPIPPIPYGAGTALGQTFSQRSPWFPWVSAGPEQKEAFFFFFFFRQTNRKHIDGNVAIAHGVAVTGRPRRPSVKSEEAEECSSHDWRPHSRPNTSALLALLCNHALGSLTIHPPPLKCAHWILCKNLSTHKSWSVKEDSLLSLLSGLRRFVCI